MALQELTGLSVLFVVNTPDSPLGGETVFAQRLVEAGATVTYSGGADAPSNINGQDVFIASASLLSSDLGAGLAAVDVPGVLTEAYVWDDHNLVTTPGFLASQTQLDIVDSGHYLAAGLSGVGLTVYQTAQNLYYGEGPGAGAQVVATVAGQATQPCLIAYEVGAALVSGTAPARRVCLFMHEGWDSTANDNGLLLIDAALNWALGLDSDSPSVARSLGASPAAGGTTVAVVQAGSGEAAGPEAGQFVSAVGQAPVGTAAAPTGSGAVAAASQPGVAAVLPPTVGRLAVAVAQATTATPAQPEAGERTGTATQGLVGSTGEPLGGPTFGVVRQAPLSAIGAPTAGGAGGQAIAPGTSILGTPAPVAADALATQGATDSSGAPANGATGARAEQVVEAAAGVPASGAASAVTDDSAQAISTGERPVGGRVSAAARQDVAGVALAARAGVVLPSASQFVTTVANLPLAGAVLPEAGQVADATFGGPVARLHSALVAQAGAGGDAIPAVGQGRPVAAQHGQAWAEAPAVAGGHAALALQALPGGAGLPFAGLLTLYRTGGETGPPAGAAARPGSGLPMALVQQLGVPGQGLPSSGTATAAAGGAPTDRAPLVVYVDDRPDVVCL